MKRIKGRALVALIDHNGPAGRTLEMVPEWPARAWDAIRAEAEGRASDAIGEPGVWLFEGDALVDSGSSVANFVVGFEGSWRRLGADLFEALGL